MMALNTFDVRELHPRKTFFHEVLPFDRVESVTDI